MLVSVFNFGLGPNGQHQSRNIEQNIDGQHSLGTHGSYLFNSVFKAFGGFK